MSLVITHNGIPIAEILCLQPRRFVPRSAIAEASARAPRVDYERLRADLDAVVDPYLTGASCAPVG